MEFIILLAFGFSAEVEEFQAPGIHGTFIAVIISFTVIALILRIVYYTIMHVWSNVIVTGKKLMRRELEDDDPNVTNAADAIRNAFFQYVFVTRNTWICGSLKNIQTTLLILPKQVIERITGHGEDLDHEVKEAIKQSNPLGFLKKQHKCKNLFISLMCLPMVLLVIVFNLLIIVLLILVLVLTIPLGLGVFFWNLMSNNGFKAVPMDPEDASDGANILEIPPEIETGGEALFKCYPERTMANFQANLENNGQIDLSKHSEITYDELDVFAKTMLSLNRKKYPMRKLILDNCDLTDDKVEVLAPLLVKFDRVTLNGSQKIQSLGWLRLGKAIREPGCRMKKLELKISKNDDATIRLRREVLLEELKGMTMTAESLLQVAVFMPNLEKLYLDDVFNDNIFFEIVDKAKAVGQRDKTNNLLTAWEGLAQKILRCPMADMKLRYLSLPGCAIDDEIMEKLAPALVNIKEVHLGRNPITVDGWLSLKKALTQSPTKLSILSLRTSSSDRYNTNALAMKELSYVILMMEHVDLTGQQDIGTNGWETFIEIVGAESKKASSHIHLKSLKLNGCRIDRATSDTLKSTFDKLHHDGAVSKLEFGERSFDEPDDKFSSFFSKCCT